MSEGGFYMNGELVEPGETRCVRWPRSCGDVQAQTATAFRFCDFCLYGPPEPPARSGDGISPEEAERRVVETERARGDKLRSAVIAAALPATSKDPKP